MRYEPVSSVTAICSPCSAGDVTVTTTSLIGACVVASITLPVKAAAPTCASAGAVMTTCATARVHATRLCLDRLIGTFLLVDPDPVNTPGPNEPSPSDSAFPRTAYSDCQY